MLVRFALQRGETLEKLNFGRLSVIYVLYIVVVVYL